VSGRLKNTVRHDMMPKLYQWQDLLSTMGCNDLDMYMDFFSYYCMYA
jgi:hypothetical protein